VLALLEKLKLEFMKLGLEWISLEQVGTSLRAGAFQHRGSDVLGSSRASGDFLLQRRLSVPLFSAVPFSAIAISCIYPAPSAPHLPFLIN
jgi:hypothetical protein